MPLTAASSTTGFFQPHPTVTNQWASDVPLRRAATLFLPQPILTTLSPDFSQLSDRVLAPDILAAGVNAEHDLPYLSGSGFSSFGHTNPHALVTSSGWKYLQDFGVREGLVSRGWDASLGASVRVAQLIRLHIWSPAAAITTCPKAMQDGAIAVLKRQLDHGPSDGDKAYRDMRDGVFRSALGHLLSREVGVAWTAGQWMTERAGGSDVAGTETVATRVGFDSGSSPQTDVDGLPLGDWVVDGFKWFSSATDCACVILLAKTERGGISCFFAPTRKLVNGKEEMNGIRIQRLKNKLGTKALPTGEVEIKGLRAWLIGEEGRGVPIISAVLNTTRYYNAVSSVGSVGRGLNVARAFARVRAFPSRTAPDNLLTSIPLYAKTIARLTLRYRADLLLAMLTAALLGAAQSGSPGVAPLVPSDAGAAAALLRLVTPVTKAYTAKHAIHTLQECMEALGGVGYLENLENPELNLARIFRDANVLSIWEGTTDVLSTDTVKVLTGRTGGDALRALEGWVHSVLGLKAAGANDTKAAFMTEKRAIARAVGELVADVRAGGKEDLLSRGREVLWRIGDVLCATLLVADAERDGDEVAGECARRFVRMGGTFVVPKEGEGGRAWSEVTGWDRRIAFEGGAEAGERGARL